MKFKKNIIFLSLLFTIFFVSCSHYNDLQQDTKQSAADDDDSHNTGKDCMSCHNNSSNEASREGWWNVAGSVYNNGSPAKNVTVELWSEPNGSGFKILTLTSDKKGNFYTNKIINFNGGCYPIIISGSKRKNMISKFMGGMSCSNSSCHGGIIDQLNFN